MRNILVMLLSLVLLFSLAACGGTQDSGSSAATPSASERTTSSEASDTSTSTSISQQPTSSTSTTRKSVPTKGVTTTVTTTTTTAQQKIILCWGDSLTEGMGMESGTGTKYPDALPNLLGSDYKVWNGGYSGDTSLAIMTRQGAIKLTTKDAITFKAGESTVKLGLRREGFGFLMDDGNELSRMNIEVGTASRNPTLLRLNPITIGDRRYNLGFTFDGVADKVDGAYYVTLSRIGDTTQALTVPAGTKVTLGNTDVSDKSYCEVILMGANDGLSSSEADINLLISRYRRMVDHMKHDRYLIIVPYWNNGAFIEPFKKAFGNKAIVLTEEITAEDMKAVGVTPTDTDIGMLSKNQIPQSLRYKNNPGDVHLNKYGYKLIAQCLHERGRQLGYWK